MALLRSGKRRGGRDSVSGGGGGTPSLVSATIGTVGTSITLIFSQAVSAGAGGNGGFVPTLSGGASAMTYLSGAGSTTLVYLLARTINVGETGTLAYTQPGTGIEATTGGADVVSFSGTLITNNRAADGGGAQPTGFRPSVNLGSILAGDEYLIDKMKGARGQWDSAGSALPRNHASLNANHFPTAIPPGESRTIELWTNLQNKRVDRIRKPGTWKVRWTPTGGGGCTINFPLADGVSNLVVGNNGVTTFTLTSTSDILWLTVNNVTGSIAGADNIQVYHTDHEAALDAGEIFNPEFISQLSQFENLLFIRTLDFGNGHVGTQPDVSTITPYGYQTWGRREWGCPPEVIGKLAKKAREVLGFDVQVAVTTCYDSSDAYMLEYHTRMKAADPTGTWKVRVEGVNEPWNSIFQAYAPFGLTYWSANSLTVYDANGTPGNTAFNNRMTASYIHHSMRAWSAADAVFGADRVIPIINVQTGWYDFMQSWIHQRDTSNVLYGGQTALQVVNARGKLAFTMYPNCGLNPKAHLIADLGSQSDAYVRDLLLTEVERIKTSDILVQVNNYRARGLTAGITQYEGSMSHDFWWKHDTGTNQPQDFPSSKHATNNTLQFVADGTGWIANGDILRTPNVTAVQGLPYPYNFWVRKTGTNEVRCYASLALYNADSGNTGVGASTVNVGTFYAVPQTRFARFADKLAGVIGGAEGAGVMAGIIAALQNPTINSDTYALFVYGDSGREPDLFPFPTCFDDHNLGFTNPLSPALALLASQGTPVGDDAPTTNQRFVRADATGTGSGIDWINAYTNLPAALSRDTTYWISSGSYGNYTFDDAASGVQKIRVKRATVALHGTETGWVAGYATGQAVFGEIRFNGQHFSIDGSVRNESVWNDVAAYGIKIGGLRSGLDETNGGKYVTTTYCAIGSTYDQAPSAGTINTYSAPIYRLSPTAWANANWTIRRCAVHNGKPLLQSVSVENDLIEYCWLGLGWGKQSIRGQFGYRGAVIRHNVFKDGTQTDPNDGTSGITGDICIWDGSAGDFDNNEIYGNTIYSLISGGRNVSIVVGGDGAGWAGAGGDNTKVYNNTFAGMPEAGVFGMIDLNGSNTSARNNLFWDTAGAGVAATTVSNNVDATANPFVNYAGLDLRLTVSNDARNAGANLGSAPYNIDRNGTTRGGDGTWDAGAYEYTP